MSNQKFIEINNKLYNTKYIKEIGCDDNKCSVTVANTQTGFAWHHYVGNWLHTYNDDIIECHKDTSPYCHEKLREFINRNSK